MMKSASRSARARVGGELQLGGGFESRAADFTRRVEMVPVGSDFLLGKVEADGAVFLGELRGERQPDVTQAHNCSMRALRNARFYA